MAKWRVVRASWFSVTELLVDIRRQRWLSDWFVLHRAHRRSCLVCGEVLGAAPAHLVVVEDFGNDRERLLLGRCSRCAANVNHQEQLEAALQDLLPSARKIEAPHAAPGRAQ